MAEDDKAKEAELQAAKEAGISQSSLEEEDKFVYTKAEDVSEKSVEAVSNAYTGKDSIEMLDGLEAIRRRPGMVRTSRPGV